MKRIIAIILSLFAIICLSSCKEVNGNTDNKISVVTTVFPVYDWVREIIGENENIELTLLAHSGTDLHSFEPTVEDIMKISSSDIFVYIGGESEKWADSAIKEIKNKNAVVINLFDSLGNLKKQEEIKEGMQREEEADEEEIEYDEHIWLSLKNAKVLCEVIKDGLKQADSKNSSAYEENYQSYHEKLDLLDNNYQGAVSGSNNKTLVFADRFPFRYMTEDYGIDYFAAFVGCSAESEASFKTVVFLANKVDELGLNAIIKIESSDGSIAKTVNENTKNKNASILTLNSMQSVNSNDISDGITYIAICENNLEVLREAIK